MAFVAGLVGYKLSNDSLLIGVLTATIVLIGLIVLDLDDRVKTLERAQNIIKGEEQKILMITDKKKKGVINYTAIIIVLIILIILLILSGRM